MGRRTLRRALPRHAKGWQYHRLLDDLENRLDAEFDAAKRRRLVCRFRRLAFHGRFFAQDRTLHARGLRMPDLPAPVTVAPLRAALRCLRKRVTFNVLRHHSFMAQRRTMPPLVRRQTGNRVAFFVGRTPERERTGNAIPCSDRHAPGALVPKKSCCGQSVGFGSNPVQREPPDSDHVPRAGVKKKRRRIRRLARRNTQG